MRRHLQNAGIYYTVFFLVLLGIFTSSLHADSLTQFHSHPEDIEPDQIRYFAGFDYELGEFVDEIDPLHFTGYENAGITSDGEVRVNAPVYMLYYKDYRLYAIIESIRSINPDNPYRYSEKHYITFSGQLFKKIRTYSVAQPPPQQIGVEAAAHQYYDEYGYVRMLDLFIIIKPGQEAKHILRKHYSRGIHAYTEYFETIQPVQWLVDVLNAFHKKLTLPVEQIAYQHQNHIPNQITSQWVRAVDINPMNGFNIQLYGVLDSPPQQPSPQAYRIIRNQQHQIIRIEQPGQFHTSGYDIVYYPNGKIRYIHDMENESYVQTTELIYDSQFNLSHAETRYLGSEATGRWYVYRNEKAIGFADFEDNQQVQTYDVFTGVEPQELFSVDVLRLQPEKVNHYIQFNRTFQAAYGIISPHSFIHHEHRRAFTGVDDYAYYKWKGYFYDEVMYALHEFGGHNQLDIQRIHLIRNAVGIRTLYFIRETMIQPYQEYPSAFHADENAVALLLEYEDAEGFITERRIRFLLNYPYAFDLPLRYLPGEGWWKLYYNRDGEITNQATEGTPFIEQGLVRRMITSYFPIEARPTLLDALEQEVY
jgi:hypothetical protein